MEHFWNSSVLKPQARISSEVRLLGWNVPPSDLRAIPEHWLSYPEPPTSMHYLLGMVYLAFFLASIVGNGVVIWIFASAKSLRTPSNVFVLNLAICDFFMMMKAPIFIYNSFKKGFALGPLGCQVFSFIGAYTGIGAAASNALIANDRFNVITKPLEGKLSHQKAVLLVLLVWGYATPWAWLPTLEIWGRFVPGGYALGHVACQVFAFIGSCSGIAGGMTNAVIGYDRYNVIARPMDGKLSFTKAFLILFLIWFYTMPWALLPLFEVWGRYVPEGYLTSCTFDYLTDNFDTRLFVGSIFTCSYLIPMSLIVYYYSQIVSQVFQHEKALREQAKKMNVDSLRSNQDKNKSSAEIRIAKAAITICFLFVASWTPYGVMALIGAFGDKNLLTPGVTMIPACTCKLVACIDPYVYAISHPKYRMELQKRLPWLAITEKESDTSSTNTTAESQTTAA